MSRGIYITGAIAFSLAFIICSGILLHRQWDAHKSNISYKELATLVDSSPKQKSSTVNSEIGSMVALQIAAEKSSTVNPEPELMVTLQTAAEKYGDIYALNNDMVGWIRIDGTNIDYPVMQMKESQDYYLYRNFDKEYSKYGVPYVSEKCDIKTSDNIVLYGHHMKDGSMFSELCNYEDEEFYQQHKIIQFDTLDNFGEYEVIAVFKLSVYTDDCFEYYRFTDAESEVDFVKFVTTCKELALFDIGVTAKYGDRLITLSTCEYSQKNGRIVVVAKKVNESLTITVQQPKPDPHHFQE